MIELRDNASLKQSDENGPQWGRTGKNGATAVKKAARAIQAPEATTLAPRAAKTRQRSPLRTPLASK